jgi:uncharacterized protein YehS (DUF1456 family)
MNQHVIRRATKLAYKHTSKTLMALLQPQQSMHVQGPVMQKLGRQKDDSYYKEHGLQNPDKFPYPRIASGLLLLDPLWCLLTIPM